MSNQTYNLSLWLGAELKKRKYPFAVVYAPERFERANMDPVITFERDRQATEKIGTARGAQANPNKMYTRQLPCKIKIYARDNKRGASIRDHEELADYLVDAVITALEEWSHAERGGEIMYSEANFMTPDELEADEHAPEGYTGAVYLLRFSIGRGVVKRDYLKQARPTGTLTGTGTNVEVRLKDEDEPEVVPVGPQP